jgi:hypothetical protein
MPSGRLPGGLHRSHAVLAALVVLAAVWAYWAAHRGPGGSAAGQKVTVWELPLRDIATLAFRDGAVRAVVQPAWDAGDEPYVWVEAQAPAPRKPTPKPARRGAREPPAAEPAAPETSAFKGNSAARPLLESFATLIAERDLGPLGALEPGQFGLPAQDAYLELARAQGPPLRLELGRAGFGGNTRYAHEPGSGRLYLLRATELRRLATARGSLMDRDLLGLKLNEAARIELTDGTRSATFHKLQGPGQWAASAEAEEGNAEAGALVNLLQGLAVVRYLDEGSAEPGPPALEARVFLPGSEEPAGWVHLFAGSGPQALARSAHSRRLVEAPAAQVRQALERARALLQDR